MGLGKHLAKLEAEYLKDGKVRKDRNMFERSGPLTRELKEQLPTAAQRRDERKKKIAGELYTIVGDQNYNEDVEVCSHIP